MMPTVNSSPGRNSSTRTGPYLLIRPMAESSSVSLRQSDRSVMPIEEPSAAGLAKTGKVRSISGAASCPDTDNIVCAGDARQVVNKPWRGSDPRALRNNLRQRLIERQSDCQRLRAGARNPEHLQHCGDLRFASASADAFGDVEDAVDAFALQRFEHFQSPSEADWLVAGGANGGFQRLDRFDGVELFELIAFSAGRFQVVRQPQSHYV